jgi:hypothetical protein
MTSPQISKDLKELEDHRSILIDFEEEPQPPMTTTTN